MERLEADRGKTRDRERTEGAILAAATAQLAEQGFPGFGVNRVARRAGCDKQLLYRYFGGLEGLVAAIGRSLAERVERAEAASPVKAATYAALSERLLMGFLEGFRADPLAQRIAAWEVAEASPLVTVLARARAEALARWMERQRGDLLPPPGVDVAALNAILIGAVQQLVLASGTMGRFAGLPLAEEEDWIRVRVALRTLVRGAYFPAEEFR
jgi:AcrR family transcriptional regulator